MDGRVEEWMEGWMDGWMDTGPGATVDRTLRIHSTPGWELGT